MRCPLCGSGRGAGPGTDQAPALHARRGGAAYYRCPACALVFLDPAHHLPPEDERARYETHRNDPGDARYRAFLDRLASPLRTKLAPGAEGLDYGSGPGPTLSRMLEEHGFRMSVYDPFFAPDRAVLERRYDFVTCTETAEHFFDPAAEFARFGSLVRPGGWLAVMTGVLTEDIDFDTWWYVRDPTHVCFYTPATLRWIADRLGWSLERPADNVALFRRNAPPEGRVENRA